jgi:hypothetical protein
VLKLRRGVVVEARAPEGGWQRLTAEIGGEQRPAVADVGMVGLCEPGDEVVVNVEARDLALGSGGFDVVHVNLTRGLAGEGTPGAHVMKLNYSSLQHAVLPVEEAGARGGAAASAGDDESATPPSLELPLRAPAAIFPLHGHLAPVAWALAQVRPGTRVGYVQTAGGALPGALSATVRELLERGLLTGHTTAGPTYGGPREAITTAGAIHDGIAALGWDVVLAGPGPGILGSGSPLGHGGIVALDSAHAALALGCRAVLVARMSAGDPRPRHRGLSHHTRTVLDLLLAPVTLPVPFGAVALLAHGLPAAAPAPAPADAAAASDAPASDADPGDAAAASDADLGSAAAELATALAAARARGHVVHESHADLDGYRASGLPTRTMGRDLDDDRPFFAAALAAGTTLGGMLR